MTLIEKLLDEEEGRRKQPYYDSLGYATVGVGHLIDPRKPCPLSDAVIDLLLHEDIARHRTDAEKLPAFAALNEVRQCVMISMVFQLGYVGVIAFKNMLKAIEAGDFEKAAKEGLDSTWAHQTPQRAKRQMAMLASGEWLPK